MYVRITEQPAPKGTRFRYATDGSSASIPGVSSSTRKKTFPSIQVMGYQGMVRVIISLVEKKSPYRPHPHNLVGDACDKGVYRADLTSDDMKFSFCHLRIQCTKMNQVSTSLLQRSKQNVDPFKTGFQYRFDSKSIDLSVVRLCFQVFVQNSTGKFTEALAPVVSEPIYDLKIHTDLRINHLSHCCSPVTGGLSVVILCEKIRRDDILVRFFQESDGVIQWQQYGNFSPSEVHKQTAIIFQTPCYKDINVTSPVEVKVELVRPSDGAISEPRPFTLLPTEGEEIRQKNIRLVQDWPMRCCNRHAEGGVKHDSESSLNSAQHVLKAMLPLSKVAAYIPFCSHNQFSTMGASNVDGRDQNKSFMMQTAVTPAPAHFSFSGSGPSSSNRLPVNGFTELPKDNEPTLSQVLQSCIDLPAIEGITTELDKYETEDRTQILTLEQAGPVQHDAFTSAVNISTSTYEFDVKRYENCF